MACNSVCSVTKLHSSSFALCPFPLTYINGGGILSMFFLFFLFSHYLLDIVCCIFQVKINKILIIKMKNTVLSDNRYCFLANL